MNTLKVTVVQNYYLLTEMIPSREATQELPSI
jgi:hypothetical protein